VAAWHGNLRAGGARFWRLMSMTGPSSPSPTVASGTNVETTI
jgi:hypothetical protein